MNPTATDSYFETQVLTAPPQKLQLMLLDAAIRACRSTREHWRAGENEPGGESLLQAQQIVGQLLAALDFESKTELVKKVAGVYLFVYRSLTEAALQRDEQKIEAAQKILETERETWRQLCEKLGSLSPDQRETIPSSSRNDESRSFPPSSVPLFPSDALSPTAPADLSLEA
ncbi:MAG: flagellar export chaperone FliS [Pirellulales bacterium]|nr:flagellar export chaperone FliS [Pirellulales bacterium]